MTQHIVKCKVQDGQPVLPPFESREGPQLLYPRPGEPVRVNGGYSVIGGLAPGATECLVLVDCPPTTLAAIRADKTAYTWLEDEGSLAATPTRKAAIQTALVELGVSEGQYERVKAVVEIIEEGETQKVRDGTLHT